MSGRFGTALLALAAALPALLQSAAASAWEPPDVGDRETWEARFEAARDDVIQAHQRVREATQAYQQARHRRRIRGDAKQQIIDEIAEAEAALEAAEERLEQLFERARRAGVPPGWTRARRSGAAAAPEP